MIHSRRGSSHSTSWSTFGRTPTGRSPRISAARLRSADRRRCNPAARALLRRPNAAARAGTGISPLLRGSRADRPAACACGSCSRVFPGEDDHAAARQALPSGDEPLLAWHPGSGSPRKNWPVARWLEVLAALRERRRFRLVVVTGEAEHAWRDRSGVPSNSRPTRSPFRSPLPPSSPRSMAAAASTSATTPALPPRGGGRMPMRARLRPDRSRHVAPPTRGCASCGAARRRRMSRSVTSSRRRSRPSTTRLPKARLPSRDRAPAITPKAASPVGRVLRTSRCARSPSAARSESSPYPTGPAWRAFALTRAARAPLRNGHVSWSPRPRFRKAALEELASRIASHGFQCVQFAPPKAVAGFDADAAGSARVSR